MIKIYTTEWCPYCNNAKRLLKSNNLDFHEINIDITGISREQLAELTGGMSVPQILINNKPVGGYTELVQLNQSGKLKELMSN